MIRIINCFASIARESDRGFKIPTIMNKAEYHIYLVTTKGCKGCEIQERIIKQALDIIEANIHLHISDYTKFKHTNPEYDKFRDFPTTLYVYNGVVLARTIGTQPLALVLDKIYSCFNVHPPKYLEDVTESH